MKRLLLLLLFARAIPLAAQSGSLHFLEVPAYDPQTGWTLRWASQTGRDYKLQRSADMVTWEDVAVVRATGEEAELTDSQSQTTLRRFWRVALLESGETDVVSPVVSNLRAAVLDDGSGGRALLLLSLIHISEPTRPY